MSRAATAGAALSFSKVAHLSRKRGRPKKSGVSRHPGGQIRSDGGTEHAAVQREALVDGPSATRSLRVITIPEAARTRQEHDTVHATFGRARDPLLGSLVGRAFKRGLFSDDGGDGHELVQAADIYAALHRQIWGKLPDDIEADLVKRYGPHAFNLLLEVGRRIGGPAPPASHFRKLVGETPHPPAETDLKHRLRQADRFGAARAALYGSKGELQRRGAVVENIVIWAIEPSFLRDGVLRTVRMLDEQTAFVGGLRALTEHFDLFDRRDRPAPRGEHA